MDEGNDRKLRLSVLKKEEHQKEQTKEEKHSEENNSNKPLQDDGFVQHWF
jgi:hypothetical protein